MQRLLVGAGLALVTVGIGLFAMFDLVSAAIIVVGAAIVLLVLFGTLSTLVQWWLERDVRRRFPDDPDLLPLLRIWADHELVSAMGYWRVQAGGPAVWQQRAEEWIAQLRADGLLDNASVDTAEAIGRRWRADWADRLEEAGGSWGEAMKRLELGDDSDDDPLGVVPVDLIGQSPPPWVLWYTTAEVDEILGRALQSAWIKHWERQDPALRGRFRR